MKDKLDKQYAPVLIPTLCRYEHFVRCIESLKNNTWSKYTDIYIGLDYPKKDSHWDGYNKICKYLEGEFNEFNSFNVIKRSENYGAGRNMSELREYVLKKFDRFIRTDDDAEFSPNFLEYMNKCLEYYDNDEDIIAVTGYSYPVDWDVDKECTLFEINSTFHMWGTGFWKRKFIKFENDLRNGYLKEKFIQNIEDKNIYELIDARFIDYVNGALDFKGDNLLDKVVDVSLGIYLTLENKKIIMPTISKVRNHGFDGTGVYCQKIVTEGLEFKKISASNYNYSNQPIDDLSNFSFIPSYQNNFKENRYLMNEFDSRSKSSVKKAKFKIFLYRTLGEKKYKNILRIKRSYK